VTRGALVTREFSEDQHLDILIALDAGRFSRVRAGRLDRFGLYANITARFSQLATANEDRVGLVVFAERPLAVCAPDRGWRAVTRLQATLARCAAQPCESDPLAAALQNPDLAAALRPYGPDCTNTQCRMLQNADLLAALQNRAFARALQNPAVIAALREPAVAAA